MPPIFNSLGSNYSFKFVTTAIAQLFSDSDQRPVLAQALTHHFSGQIKFFYKGRDAIQYALENWHIGKGDEVLVQAFACYAIEEAITRTGARPVYVDVAQNSLNVSVETLTTAYKQAKRPKAVLIQHTLGLPAPIQSIKVFCQQHQLLLIEDLAQSYGARDDQGQLLGTTADAVILSFGRDKILDGVNGGAVKAHQLTAALTDQPIPHTLVLRDLLYPFITWSVRQTHSWGLGKILFWLAKKFHIITSPIASPIAQMRPMPKEFAPLILSQLVSLSDQLNHRRQIAQHYYDRLKSKNNQLVSLINPQLIQRGANLRFPVWVAHPDQLTKALTQQKIYLTDRWYRQPVDCGSLACQSLYVKGSCPQAELAAQHVINLPTHQYISLAQADYIIDQILKDHHA